MSGNVNIDDALAKFAPSAPQDPFLPERNDTIGGPIFLDTGACLCAYGRSPVARSDPAKWHCIGNQTDGLNVTSGKWFNTVKDSAFATLPMDDASQPPDVSKPLMFDDGSNSLVSVDEHKLTAYDNACTGVNNTLFSTARYRVSVALAQDDVVVDALPCYRPGAVPIQMQNLTSFQERGCLPGFLCMNNTVNSLPHYCPPVTECQQARLGGRTCQLNDTNVPMGPFEPIICQEGHYCPPPGVETKICPSGTYCQPGAATPTPCSIGMACPEGSVYGRFLIPIMLLLLSDIAFVIAIFIAHLRKRRRPRPRPVGEKEAPKPKRTMTLNPFRGLNGYSELAGSRDGYEDYEMAPMGATYMPSRDNNLGFQAALAMQDIHKKTADELKELSPELKVFLESMRRVTEANRFGLSFTYAGLSFHPKSSPRPILQNMTGSIRQGSLVAVMGGSGAGKSTFVNVLMGKTSNTGGTVMVNHLPGKIKRYKKLIGYVPQDDIVLPELTVFENILHSARVRLPRSWAHADIEAHVEAVVDCLELSHVRNSLVGSVGKPVISGGQRKRVSIGMELAAAPMAIFLDEPTSGLDATAASSIMKTLKAIARLGISVITIIHQPRMEIFEALDDLILLGNGQTIYEGPQVEVQAYFERSGYHFPEHSNTGDVVTDIITGNGRVYKEVGDISKESLIGQWDRHRQAAADEVDPRASVLTLNVPDRNIVKQVLKRRGARRHKQILLCLSRAMLQQYRVKSSFWFEMALASLSGFLLGLAENSKRGILFTGFYKDPYTILSTAIDLKSVPEVALLVAIAVGLVSSAPGVRVFSEEMLLQRRESEAGHSRIAYFLAKLVSILPRMALGCFHFTTWFFLLAVPTMPWGTAFVANLAYFYCIYGLASIISMVARREDAPLLATMLSLVVGLFSGASPPLAKVQSWHLEWLWRMSPGVWLAEFYFAQMVSPFEYLYDIQMAQTLTGFRLDWGWINIGVLVGIGTAYRVLAFIGLVAGQRLRI
ncbi:hypothetical protein GQ53DRAFT_677677 [Thozetella sp. PMI_491]|nr:hypothetical protein GQ53DRAFT_677677 [Thozetella sp. PMI_491]